MSLATAHGTRRRSRSVSPRASFTRRRVARTAPKRPEPNRAARRAGQGRPLRPLSYLKLCRYAGVTLEPGQRVACKVAFDGVEPKDLVGEERELARTIFGNIETVSARARKVFAAVCGGRSGKSFLFGAMRMLHLALTVDVNGLARGEIGVALILAPNRSLATQQLTFVKGIIEGAGLWSTVVKDNESCVRLLRSDGRVVEVGVKAIGKRGTGGRGRSLVGCCIDEANFIDSKGYVVNDEDAYSAAQPRIIRGGQMVICSTPFVRAGLLYTFHRDFHGKDNDVCLSAHAPTRVLRTDAMILEIVDAQYEHDHANAEREYGAVFPASGSNLFFEESTIEKASELDYDLPNAPKPGGFLTAGGDIGLVNNSAALCIAVHYPAHKRRMDDMDVAVPEAIEVVDLLELIPKEEPLKLSEVCASFAACMKPWGIDTIMADGHNREAAREHLAAHGVKIINAPDGQKAKEQTYVDTRIRLREGRVRVPRVPRLLLQLGEVRYARTTRGRLAISSPVKPDGSHGDLVSCFVLAVWKNWGPKVYAEQKVTLPPEERERIRQLERSMRPKKSGSLAD